MNQNDLDSLLARRRLLKAGLAGVCTHTASMAGLPLVFGSAAQALAAAPGHQDRILVVFEMSGGNDGLNTLVPYADDAYYRRRPNIGIKPGKLRKIEFALDDEIFVAQLLTLRLAVLLCHARRDPEVDTLRLSRGSSPQSFELRADHEWAERYPQSAHLLREEVLAWQKANVQLTLQIN